jgi:dissimilatory sulfite reductase (desulfoviridin) alpha/beta subunit
MGSARTGLDLYAGGRWGREKQVGVKLATFLGQEEALGAIGRIKSWYARNGERKERLGQTILRLGVRAFQAEVLEGVDSTKWAEISTEVEAKFQPSR